MLYVHRLPTRYWSLGLTAVFAAAFVGLWQLLTAMGVLHRIVLPQPGAVIARAFEIAGTGYFHEHLLVTLREVFSGFAGGSGTAIVLAFVTVRFDWFRRMVQPLIVTFQALPKVIVIPILAIWFGNGPITAMLVVALVTFFPVYVNTVTGLTIADEDGMRLLRSLGATPRQMSRMLRLPRALPLVFTGLKTSMNFAFVGALTAEMLGSPQGVGFLIASAGAYFRINDVYALVVLISLLAGFTYLVMELIDRKLVFWREPVFRTPSEAG